MRLIYSTHSVSVWVMNKHFSQQNHRWFIVIWETFKISGFFSLHSSLANSCFLKKQNGHDFQIFPNWYTSFPMTFEDAHASLHEGSNVTSMEWMGDKHPDSPGFEFLPSKWHAQWLQQVTLPLETSSLNWKVGARAPNGLTSEENVCDVLCSTDSGFSKIIKHVIICMLPPTIECIFLWQIKSRRLCPGRLSLLVLLLPWHA